ASGFEPLERVLANRAEHVEARLSFQTLTFAKQALVHERCELVERRAADDLSRFEGAAARKTGEVYEQDLLARREEVIAPVDRCSKRLLSCGRLAGAAGQQRQALPQSRQQRLRREQPDPNSGKLERERESIHTQTDLRDGA